MKAKEKKVGSARKLFALVLCLLGFSASAAAPKASGETTTLVLIPNVPHVRQKGDFQGEACAEMWLGALGSRLRQDDVFALCEVDPALGRGANAPELYKALTRIGFKVGQVWNKVRAANKTEIEAAVTNLVNDLAQGIPSIVCMRTSSASAAAEQYRLVLGYDRATDEVIFHDPADNAGAYLRLARSVFTSLWPAKSSATEWTLVRLRLEKAGKLMEPPPAKKGASVAEYALHCLALRKKLPLGFTVVVEEPFVVLGDESPDMVRARARQTVRWLVDRLRLLYGFENDPGQITDIWFFKDTDSYRKHVWEIFSVMPRDTVGGYLEENKAIIASTTSGTSAVVREIVRLFLQANFPQCPVWFAEGLGLLYEQCAAGSGPLTGLSNWRLGVLQKAVRSKTVIPLAELFSAGKTAFRGEDSALHCAEVRYLCYYLQQKKLLPRFYQELRKNATTDPKGSATLLRLLGATELSAFQKRWEAFVLELTPP
ncbi:MAG: hypothetical protein ACUVWX_06165 [Kiritimatiellia bacterium]